jgi:hypothetical protein
MWCLNSFDSTGLAVNKKLFGPDDGRLHRRIDILYQPCDPVTYSSTTVLRDGECFVNDNKDGRELSEKLKATKEWVGTPDFTMVYNNQRMDLGLFNDESI